MNACFKDLSKKIYQGAAAPRKHHSTPPVHFWFSVCRTDSIKLFPKWNPNMVKLFGAKLKMSTFQMSNWKLKLLKRYIFFCFIANIFLQFLDILVWSEQFVAPA